MRSNWLLAALLTLSLGSPCLGVTEAEAASVERPLSGLVTQVYALSQTIYLGSLEFYVPEDVYDLTTLPIGSYVVISFERTADGWVATSIEVEDPS